MRPVKPFSKNIVFMDAEFSSLDPYAGEIISIGLVKPNGMELYLELKYRGPYTPWVKKHILPSLKEPRVSRREAIRRIKKFIGGAKPRLVSYVNDFDVIYWYKFFGGEPKKSPAYWMPVDFASILFAYGIDPESYYRGDRKNFFRKLGIDASRYREHHALDDAKLLREVYMKFFRIRR